MGERGAIESVAVTMTTVYMLLALIIGAAIVAAAKVRGMVLELRQLRAFVDALPDEQTAPTSQPGQPPQLAPIPLPGAGAALAKPPADYRLVLDALRSKAAGLYRIPLGWIASTQGGWLQTAQLVGDVNHMLITGQSDSGKDVAALNMLLALATTHQPDQLQVAIVDGKGLDWIGWQHKAHTWLLASEPEQIPDAMAALSNERQRRRKILADAGASKLENYKGGDLPLLVVFVSELLLLENAVGASKLTAWLNTELTSARACGIRYIIACQTASNFSTQWRSQISLFLAGYQPSSSQDAPNVAISTSEIEAAGAVPPSKLPAPSTGAAGVFCAVQGAKAINVRTTLISDQQRDYILSQLPAKALHQAAPARASVTSEQPAAAQDNPMLAALLAGQPLPFTDEVSSTRSSTALAAPGAQNSTPVAAGSGSALVSVAATREALPVAADIVPADEQQAILELAKKVSSRRALCKQLYEGQTGGKAYAKVQMVCDAAGLLLPAPAGQAVAA